MTAGVTARAARIAYAIFGEVSSAISCLEVGEVTGDDGEETGEETCEETCEEDNDDTGRRAPLSKIQKMQIPHFPGKWWEIVENATLR
ncbi:unnamed protein product [Rhizophagus irregularis]|nr:unnamed protein product [Rhizophagus irregularis]